MKLLHFNSEKTIVRQVCCKGLHKALRIGVFNGFMSSMWQFATNLPLKELQYSRFVAKAYIRLLE